MKTLMNKYGYKSRKSVTDKVKKYSGNLDLSEIKEKRKGYSINIKKIDSEFNAYFLGLMLTDGYICGDTTKFGIDLTDEDCIKFISEATGQEYKVYKGTQKNYKNHYRIVFSDRKAIEDLQRYGVVAKKTYTLKAPKLYEDEYIFLPYIIRGIIVVTVDILYKRIFC